MSKPTGFVEKEWGSEIIWINTDQYCGKILVFKEHIKTAMYFHRMREKSWFINSGKLLVRWIDTSTGALMEKTLEQGAVWQIKAMVPHQIEAILPDSMIFEVSTPYSDKDVFKLGPGDC